MVTKVNSDAHLNFSDYHQLKMVIIPQNVPQTLYSLLLTTKFLDSLL